MEITESSKETLERIKRESAELKKKVRAQVVGYLLTALGLVAGLAWNDAVKALIEDVFPLAQNGIAAKFLYAALITIFVVFVSAYLIRLGGEGDKK